MKNGRILGFTIPLAFLMSCASSPPPQTMARQAAAPSPPPEATAVPTPKSIDATVGKKEPQETPVTKITSSDDVTRITSQIADLIAPFTAEDVLNGLKNERGLWNQPKRDGISNFNGRIVNGQQVGTFVVNTDSGTIETLTMTKARPAGGKVSVEVGLKNGNIEVISFKVLPDRAGFTDIWNAKPVVVLSKRLSSDTSNSIGFEHVEIRQGDATTQYELPRSK